MGLLGDLFDTAVDAGKDLLSEKADGLFGSGDEGGGLLESALGAISGGDDGGGFLGGMLGGDDGGGGMLGGTLGDTATGMLGGMLGGDDGGGSGGFLGGLLDDAGGVVESVTSTVGDGSWSDSLGGIVDQWTGGGLGDVLSGEGGLGDLLGGEGGGALGDLLGGEGGGALGDLLGGEGGGALGDLLGGDGGLGGITNQMAEFLPPELSEAAGSIMGGDGNWAGSLLDQVTGDIGDQIPDEWTSITDSVLGTGLGEGGFDDWVDQGFGVLGSLGVPEDLGDIISCQPPPGFHEPGGLLGLPLPPTQGEMSERLKDLLLGTEEQPGNTGIVPPDVEVQDVMPHLEGDAVEDLDLDLGLEDGGAAAPEPAPADDLGLDGGGAPGAESDLPTVPETADIEPGDDIEMAPAEPPVAAGPATVEAPEPAPEPVDEFDQAIDAADQVESSTDELFEGLE